MSQASISDDESQLSLPPLLVTKSALVPDPGDNGSVFQATLAARAPVLVLSQRPKRGAQKRSCTKA